MLSPAPIERTIASELGCTGSLSTRRFQWLSAGKTGQPASTAAPIATPPYKSAWVARGAEAAGLALRELAVAAHVAVLAAGDQVERVLAVVVQADPDAAAVHEVELLLLLVEVAPRLEARRDLDRVHAERGHAERAADLLESRP